MILPPERAIHGVAIEIETKFLRLIKPAAIGDHIEVWRVCWVSGDHSKAAVLVHSEPLFLRDERGLRVRHLKLNNPDTAAREIKQLRPELDGISVVPYYAYVTVGTVYCTLAIDNVSRSRRNPCVAAPRLQCSCSRD